MATKFSICRRLSKYPLFPKKPRSLVQGRHFMDGILPKTPDRFDFRLGHLGSVKRIKVSTSCR